LTEQLIRQAAVGILVLGVLRQIDLLDEVLAVEQLLDAQAAAAVG
jgi:hypothetical protein